MRIRPKFDRVIRVYGSELVHTVRYDPSNHVLDVKTKAGSSYRYHGIYGTTFVKLITSASPGKVFNSEVKRGLYSNELNKPTKLRSSSW